MQTQMKRTSAVCLAFAGGMLAVAAPAGAAIVYDAGGFEPQFTSGANRFDPGALPGQDTQFGPWQSSPMSSPTAQVETMVVESGTQAVGLTRPAGGTAPISSSYYHGVFKPFTPATRYVFVDFSMRVEPTGQSATQFGPFFGVQSYDSDTATGVKLIAGIGQDASTGEVLYQDAATGNLAVGPTISLGKFHQYRQILDYSTDTFQVLVDGTPVASGNFVDDGVLGEIDAFTDADLVALPSSGDPASLAAAGTAYFDKYIITTGNVVPEPSMAIVAFGFGAAGLIRRRRTTR